MCAGPHAQRQAVGVADACAPPAAQLRARARSLADALAAAEERAAAAEAQRDALAVNISRVFRVRTTAAKAWHLVPSTLCAPLGVQCVLSSEAYLTPTRVPPTPQTARAELARKDAAVAELREELRAARAGR